MSLPEVAPDRPALLVAAGFVDAIAGGGGLITVPALLITGTTPAEALGLFAMVGKIWWASVLCMALAQMAGAQLGSRLAMRAGARLIKPLLVTVSLILALKLMIG